MTTLDEIERALPLVPGGQADFVLDQRSPFKALVGGMGSGKSAAAGMNALLVGSMNAPASFLFVAPTYSLIEDATLPMFETLLRRTGIASRWHASKKRLTVGVGRHDAFDIWMRSGDNPERIVAFESGAACIDEPGLMSPAIFKRVVQRVRHPAAKLQQIALSGTPEDLNWFYDLCEGNPPKGMRVYRARTQDNPYQTERYIQKLRETLSEQEIEAYLNGKFVNLKAGRVYKAFDRALHHERLDYQRSMQIVVGCDFNVDKMSWVIGIVRGDVLNIVDEVIGMNTNTYRQVEALTDRLRDMVHAVDPFRAVSDIVRDVIVYTDAAGKNRTTSANESDIQILRAAGFDVRCAPANPPIKDRVHSVEAKLRGAFTEMTTIIKSDTPTLMVDTAKAKELTKSLEGQPWGPDRLPAKGKGALDMSGPVDALGYLVWGHPQWRASLPKGNHTMHEHSYLG